MNAFEQPQNAPESGSEESPFKKGDYVTWSPDLLERVSAGETRVDDPVRELVTAGSKFVVQSVEGSQVEIRLPTGQTMRVSKKLLGPFSQQINEAA